MRAREIVQEQTDSLGSQLLAKVGGMWIWQVPTSFYNTFYEQNKDNRWNKALPLPTNGIIYFVSKKTGQRYDSASHSYVPYPLTPDKAQATLSIKFRLFTKQGDNLISLFGSADITPGVLIKLAELTHAQNAPNLPADKVKQHVLVNGKVQTTDESYSAYMLAPLSNNAKVFKVPRSDLWKVGRTDWQDDPSWDTTWYINSPDAEYYGLYGLGDTIIQYSAAAGKAWAWVSEIKELAQREGLQLKVTLPAASTRPTSKRIATPGSNMHKMLAYVSEHPGASRSDWFVDHLGLSKQGMQGWTSDKSPDGVAYQQGWIKNADSKGVAYSLSITAKGKLVLARLNAGKPVPYTVLL